MCVYENRSYTFKFCFVLTIFYHDKNIDFQNSGESGYKILDYTIYYRSFSFVSKHAGWKKNISHLTFVSVHGCIRVSFHVAVQTSFSYRVQDIRSMLQIVQHCHMLVSCFAT